MLQTIKLSVVVSCFTLVSVVNTKSLPSFVKPCKKSDQNIEVCISKVVESLRPRLAKGIPELGVPPCDPLVIPRLELKQPQGASVGFDAVLTNISFTRGLDFKLLKSNLNLKENFVAVKIQFPHLNVEGEYKSTGKIFIAQFQGEGKCHGNFDNVTVSGVWNFKREQKNSKEYFKVTDTKVNVDVEKLHMIFENLFKNNKMLTDVTNNLINENYNLLYNEVKPIVVETMTGIMEGVIKHVLDQYPAEELLDED